MSATGMTLDTRQFQSAISSFAKETGVDMGFALRWQMALWVKDLIKRTQGSWGKSLFEQKKAGEAAVKNDLKALFEPIANKKMLQGMRDDLSTKDLIYRIWGGNRVSISRNQIPSDINMPGAHQGMRQSRGRVRMKPLKQYVSDVAFRKYQKEVLKHVGRAKSGWASAAEYFGQKAHGLVPNMLPAWIKRNAGWAVGKGYTMKSDVQQDTMHIQLVAGNDVPYVRPGNMMNSSLQTRTNDLTKYAQLRIKKLCEKYSAQKGAA